MTTFSTFFLFVFSVENYLSKVKLYWGGLGCRWHSGPFSLVVCNKFLTMKLMLMALKYLEAWSLEDKKERVASFCLYTIFWLRNQVYRISFTSLGYFHINPESCNIVHLQGRACNDNSFSRSVNYLAWRMLQVSWSTNDIR